MRDAYTTELKQPISRSGAPASQALVRSLAWLVLATALTACGGSSNDASEDGDTIAPSARILFPPAQGMTDADSITVTGTAADAGTITVVRVNGVDATSSDGFASWRAVVPLAAGANDLSVETGDQAGNMDAHAASASLLNQPIYTSPFDLEFDAARNRLLMVDLRTITLLGLDFDDGGRTRISGRDDAPARLGTIAYDVAGDRVIGVAEGFSPRRLYSIDLTTGEHSLFSSTAQAGPDFGSSIQALAYDDSLGAGMERVLTAEVFFLAGGVVEGRILSVDLATGDRTVLSESGDGKGGDFQFSRSIAVDSAGNRAFVGDDDTFGNASVFEVALDTGNRSIISADDGDFAVFTDLAFDPAGGILYAVRRSDEVIKVNIDTGERSTLSGDPPSGPVVGGGPEFSLISAIEFDPVANRLLVADDGLDAVVAVDPASGDRTIVDGNGVGTGEVYTNLREIELDPNTDRVYVYDQAGKIIEVSLDDGARSLVSMDNDGKGPNITSNTTGIGIDIENDRLLVSTENPFTVPIDSRLVGVTLDTGTRSIIADPITRGSGNVSIIRDTTSSRAISVVASTIPRLNQVDLTTGIESVFSGTPIGGMTVGAGDDFIASRLTGITLDVTNDRVLVMQDRNTEFEIIGVDLANGNRTSLLRDLANPQWDSYGRIGYDAARNRVIMTDAREEAIEPGPGVVYADLDDDSHDILANRETGEGVGFRNPVDIAIHQQRDLAVVVDQTLRALVAVDLQSGDRVIFSK